MGVVAMYCISVPLPGNMVKNYFLTFVCVPAIKGFPSEA